MTEKLNLDTFVYDGTFIEGFSNGAWKITDLNESQIEKGMLFLPNTSLNEVDLIYLDSDELLCLTIVDIYGLYYSFKHKKKSEIKDTLDIIDSCLNNKIIYFKIYKEKDAISIQDYLNKNNISISISLSDLEKVKDILSKNKIHLEIDTPEYIFYKRLAEQELDKYYIDLLKGKKSIPFNLTIEDVKKIISINRNDCISSIEQYLDNSEDIYIAKTKLPIASIEDFIRTASMKLAK